MKVNKILIVYSTVATIVAAASGISCFKLVNRLDDQVFINTNLEKIANMKQERLNDYASKKITLDILDKQIKDAQDQLETLKNEIDESN